MFDCEVQTQSATNNTRSGMLKISINYEDDNVVTHVLKAQLDMTTQYLAIVCNEVSLTAGIISEIENLLRAHQQLDEGAQLLGTRIGKENREDDA